MPNIVNEAIANAEAIREVAEERVKEALVHKFSSQVKKAVNRILEVNMLDDPNITDEGLEGEDMFGELEAGMEAEPRAADPITGQIEQEAIGSEFDDNETELGLDKVVIDFDELNALIGNEEEGLDGEEEDLLADLGGEQEKEGNFDASPMPPVGARDPLTEADKKENKSDDNDDVEVNVDIEVEDDKDEKTSDDVADVKKEKSIESCTGDPKHDGTGKGVGKTEDRKGIKEGEEESITISHKMLEEMVQELAERIVHSINGVGHGHLGRLTSLETDEWALLKQATDELENKNDKLDKKNKELSESIEKVAKMLKESERRNFKNIKFVAQKVKEIAPIIEASQIQNDRMSAIAGILSEENLNTKQKSSIISSIRSASTLTEIKANYESAMTLNESPNNDNKSVSLNRQMFNHIQKATLTEQNVVETPSQLNDEKSDSIVLTEDKRRMQEKAGIIKQQ